jgi:hypothetical protein
VTVATFAAQLALHQTLSAAGTGAGGMAGHQHSLGRPTRPDHGVHVSGGVMLLAHLLAATAVAVLLHATDDRLAALPLVLGRFAASVRTTLARWLRFQVHHRVPTCRTRHFGEVTTTAAGAMLDHVLVRRGPPRSRATTDREPSTDVSRPGVRPLSGEHR